MTTHQEPKHVRPVLADHVDGMCSRCKRNLHLCICRLPYPTQPTEGLYSRAQYEYDLSEIEKISARFDTLIAAHQLDGVEFKLHCEPKLTQMRKLCKSMLMRTAAILRAEDNEEEEDEPKRNKFGVRISTSGKE